VFAQHGHAELYDNGASYEEFLSARSGNRRIRDRDLTCRVRWRRQQQRQFNPCNCKQFEQHETRRPSRDDLVYICRNALRRYLCNAVAVAHADRDADTQAHAMRVQSL
jgi:hypothetical protein